ncbi:MAG: ribosome biogenesis GTPase Der, partial [Deltaproteobacteria bacterium]|nr:ribosome biogenesis GTPase Der [Deltaproteobacteria bacterium]
MSPPLVALVGRPNVGKSTLFNRLVGQRLAIVDDMPGVTRDRLYAEAERDGHAFAVVDTGGYEPLAGDSLLVGMREQARLAMEEAELICVVVDGRDGLLPADREIVQLVRRSFSRPLLVAVNKIDGPRQEALAAEFAALGVEELWPVSAAHGRGVADLLDRFVALLPWPAPGEEEEEEELEQGFALDELGEGGEEGATGIRLGEVRVAFIGRPNVGKSTLVNQLLGEQRCLVGDEPGTTRDPVDARLCLGERSYRLIDTAGLRRKSKIRLDLERYTVVRSLQAIDRSHVVCFLLDAPTGLADQEQRIAAYARRRGRAAVVLLNKWDMVEGKDGRTLGIMVRQLQEELGFLPYAPVLAISARTGWGVDEILPTVDRVRVQHLTRISTGPLNRLFQEIVEAHHPPLYKGQMVKLYYIAQTAVAPPVFNISCNLPEGLPEPYRRYIENRLRQHYPFAGTPLRFEFQKRGGPTAGGEAAGERAAAVRRSPR